MRIWYFHILFTWLFNKFLYINFYLADLFHIGNKIHTKLDFKIAAELCSGLQKREIQKNLQPLQLT